VKFHLSDQCHPYLSVVRFGFQFWQLPDFGNFGDLSHAPARPFFHFCCKQRLCSKQPKHGPCEALNRSSRVERSRTAKCSHPSRWLLISKSLRTSALPQDSWFFSANQLRIRTALRVSNRECLSWLFSGDGFSAMSTIYNASSRRPLSESAPLSARE
jgi:hypothetical protein